ncbi:MAG: hypothetical protein DCC73_14925 [Proteobacteria bacterium]|nr:MAG: hypothetical protein DCC73_14925 [Pseudomonadota bacterium]
MGDCLEILPALTGVDHIICDPPYEATLHEANKKNTLGRKFARYDGGRGFQQIDFASIDAIREPFVIAAAAKCKGWFIAFCTPEGVARWADCVNASSMKYKRACVWVKPDSTPQLNGQGPAQGAEHFVCAWGGAGYARWNAGGKRGVYTHCVNGPLRQGEHPTEKPVALLAEIILDFTSPGQVVCDPFMGSGTTGIACSDLGRKFIGIEISEKYFDLACRRIEGARRQQKLFEAPAVPAEQASLF